MIAALAAGLLGQLEGLAAPSAIAGVGSLFGGKVDAAAAATSTSNRPAPSTGVDKLNAQLNQLLLNQQSGRSFAGKTIQDDVQSSLNLG